MRGLGVWVHIGHAFFAGRLATGQFHVDEAAHAGGFDARKAVPQQHRGLERKLRRDQVLDLRIRWRTAGLVIDDLRRAIGEQVDAVGPGGQRELASGARKFQFALDFDHRAQSRAATFALKAEEPAGGARKAGPPQRKDRRRGSRFRKRLHAQAEQLLQRVVRQRIRKSQEKPFQRRVYGNAALQRSRFVVDCVERLKRKNMLGINCVGIAQPRLDLGNG